MEELRVLSPSAILGYGFPVSSFNQGMKRHPHVIAVDGGSSDPGPYYLGAGVSFTDRIAVKRDLEIIISAAIEEDIPVIVGTAGGCGGEPHLRWNVDIVKEIAKQKGLKFKIAVIHAEVPGEEVLRGIKEGRITPLGPVPPLKKEDVEDTVRIVAQMGIEPFIEAIERGALLIMAGRAFDPAVFAALAVKKGYDAGLALHMGKILECASIAADPGSGSDCMMGYLRKDCFKVEPLNPARRCTTLSVAAHTLYEKSNPYVLAGPGGVLDLNKAKFEQETDRMVKVTGSRFIPSRRYTLKLEGAKRIGYRTISVAGVRDPVMISEIDNIIQSVKHRVEDNFKDSIKNYFLDFKVYGKNGVMGQLEPNKDTKAFELGIVIEAVAKTQENANTICSFARSTMLHHGYEGRISTAGNLAFPYSPSDFKAGEVYEFSIYHLMQAEDANQFFPVETMMSLED